MTADEILKLIETVSPDDSAKLDEIDARVCAYVGGYEFRHLVSGGWAYSRIIPMGEAIKHKHNGNRSLERTPKFTRCRTTLKSIRPEGWRFSIMQRFESMDDPGRCFIVETNKKFKDRHPKFWTGVQWTEELAELHAIIQAIGYERGQADRRAK